MVSESRETLNSARKVHENLIRVAHQLHQDNGKETLQSLKIKQGAHLLHERVNELVNMIERMETNHKQEIDDKKETITELKQRIELELLTNLELKAKLQEHEQDKFSESW